MRKIRTVYSLFLGEWKTLKARIMTKGLVIVVADKLIPMECSVWVNKTPE